MFIALGGSDNAQSADRLVGIHSAIAVTQSLPVVAREAGLFKKNFKTYEAGASAEVQAAGPV